MFYFKVFWLSEVKQQNKLIEFKETMPCLLKQTNKKKNKKRNPPNPMYWQWEAKNEIAEIFMHIFF